MVAALAFAGCSGPRPLPTPAPSLSAPPTISGIPAADVAWKKITWRKLGPTDELATFQTVARVPGGFVSLGVPVSTQSGFRTPLELSADGVRWQKVGASVVGGDAIVIGIYASTGTLVALTLTGGAQQCEDAVGPCLHVRPPLRAWTSIDGATWTLTAEPLELRVAPDTGELDDLPEVAIAGSRLLVGQGGHGLKMASTNDGRAWTTITPTGLAPGFEGELAGAVGGGFVLAGSSGGSQGERKPLVAWSADGTNWESAALPVENGVEGSAGRFVDAARGMVIDVSTDLAPGGPSWWSSTDGRDWTPIKSFAPLGTWEGAGEGSGGLPNGQLVADGERLVAYNTVDGSAAWTSFDGVTWTDLAIAGDKPPTTNGRPGDNITASPIGLFWRDNRGNVWFGEPSA